MKIRIALLTLTLLITAMLAPLSLANKDFSSFDVSEIFIEEENNPDDTSDDKSVIGGLETASQAEGAASDSPIVLFILRVINILTLLVGTFAFVMILIGGFIFATSGGDEGRVDKGKSIISQAVIGLVFAFMSYSIVLFVQSFFY